MHFVNYTGSEYEAPYIVFEANIWMLMVTTLFSSFMLKLQR